MPSENDPISMVGSVAANLHEGSRSEYLAQFVFSGFGTAVPVPHQEDSGLDIYCTLLERVGQRAWPRAYYSVQVKSTLSPWVFASRDSVRWIIEHPLPIFLCVVLKSEARLLVYHTTPRFAVWALPTTVERLELIPGTGTEGRTVDWDAGTTFNLPAPILNFTVQEILNAEFRARVAEVLKFWIDYDTENLARIRNGINRFRVPYDYKTNTIELRGWTTQGGWFREDSLRVAIARLKELLGLIVSHHHRAGDMQSAAIYATALRHLAPSSYEHPMDPHDTSFLFDLNKAFGMSPPKYLFQACDSLVQILKDELAKHGIKDSGPAADTGP